MLRYWSTARAPDGSYARNRGAGATPTARCRDAAGRARKHYPHTPLVRGGCQRRVGTSRPNPSSPSTPTSAAATTSPGLSSTARASPRADAVPAAATIPTCSTRREARIGPSASSSSIFAGEISRLRLERRARHHRRGGTQPPQFVRRARAGELPPRDARGGGVRAFGGGRARREARRPSPNGEFYGLYAIAEQVDDASPRTRRTRPERGHLQGCALEIQ